MPVTPVDGSSRKVVWFPVHGTALHAPIPAVLKFLQLAGIEALAIDAEEGVKKHTLSCHIIISAKLKAHLLLFPKAQD